MCVVVESLLNLPVMEDRWCCYWLWGGLIGLLDCCVSLVHLRTRVMVGRLVGRKAKSGAPCLLLYVNCLGGVVCVLRTLGVVGRGSCGCLLVVSLAFCGGGTDGLYALSGRSRSGKAADSFRMWGDDCFALLLCWWLLMVHDDDGDMTRRWVMGGRLMIMMLFYLFVLVCSCACAGVFLGDLFANSFSVAVVLLLFLRGVGRSVGAISRR